MARDRQGVIVDGRRFDCDGCGKPGVWVDTVMGFILDDKGRNIATAPPTETYLMADEAGNIVCDDCDQPVTVENATQLNPAQQVWTDDRDNAYASADYLTVRVGPNAADPVLYRIDGLEDWRKCGMQTADVPGWGAARAWVMVDAWLEGAGS